MPESIDLLPELRKWNGGAGISPEDWIYLEGRADHALGFCSFFWPELVAFEGYVLRAPLDVDRLRRWEAAGVSRQQVEIAMNALLFDDMFPDDETDAVLKSAQLTRLAEIMSDMLAAKLKLGFPELTFTTAVLQEDDFGLSFYQT